MSHLSKNLARVDAGTCVACGCCLKVCPRQALSVFKGSYAVVNQDACVGCGLCAKECPASLHNSKLHHLFPLLLLPRGKFARLILFRLMK